MESAREGRPSRSGLARTASCGLTREDLVRECWGGANPAGLRGSLQCSAFNFGPADDYRQSSSDLLACVDCSKGTARRDEIASRRLSSTSP